MTRLLPNHEDYSKALSVWDGTERQVLLLLRTPFYHFPIIAAGRTDRKHSITPLWIPCRRSYRRFFDIFMLKRNGATRYAVMGAAVAIHICDSSYMSLI